MDPLQEIAHVHFKKIIAGRHNGLCAFILSFVERESLRDAEDILVRVGECVRLGGLTSSYGYTHEGDERGPCMREVLTSLPSLPLGDVASRDVVGQHCLAVVQADSCKNLFKALSKFLVALDSVHAGDSRCFMPGVLGPLAFILKEAAFGGREKWPVLSASLRNVITRCEKKAEVRNLRYRKDLEEAGRSEDEYVRSAQNEGVCLCDHTDRWGGPCVVFCTVHQRRSWS